MGQTIAAQPSDAELLEASRRGEHHAFGELVGRYQRVVSAVSYSRTRDRALGEDVAQETFLAAWRQLGQLREPSRLRSWLCGIARNLASKAKKRTAREVPIDGEPEIVARGNPFDAVSEAQAEQVVGEALSNVPETYREVLVLYYQEQLSAREVSEALDISEAAAMQRLSRGRQYLADGVTSLVEKSLRRRPRRDLRAAVLAALPAAGLLVPSRAEAATATPHGGSMIKLALVATALVAIGTTAVVVAHRSDDAPVTQSKVEPRPSPAYVQPQTKETPKLAPPNGGLRPALPEDNLPPGAMIAPKPDQTPSIDDARIKQLGLDRGPSRGPKNAPVTIVMFTDLQCVYCGKAHGTLDQLFDEYPNKLRLVIKQMPVHKTAELAAEAALAADAQGKFWELDRLMIANHEDLSLDAILALGKQGGLDVARLKADLENHTYASALEDDRKTASALEVQATPSFIINGRKVVGALPIDEIRKTIEASLKD